MQGIKLVLVGIGCPSGVGRRKSRCDGQSFRPFSVRFGQHTYTRFVPGFGQHTCVTSFSSAFVTRCAGPCRCLVEGARYNPNCRKPSFKSLNLDTTNSSVDLRMPMLSSGWTPFFVTLWPRFDPRENIQVPSRGQGT